MIDTIRLIKKYYSKKEIAHSILLTHSKLVTQKALYMARKHPELQLDTTFIEEAAMLHDIGIFLCDAPKIGCYGKKEYVCHGYLGADILRNENLPKHALVCERHTGTGLSLEEIIKQNLPIPHRDMVPISLEEQIICFADKFFSKSNPKHERSFEHVLQSLSKFGDHTTIQLNTWAKMFL